MLPNIRKQVISSNKQPVFLYYMDRKKCYNNWKTTVDISWVKVYKAEVTICQQIHDCTSDLWIIRNEAQIESSVRVMSKNVSDRTRSERRVPSEN